VTPNDNRVAEALLAKAHTPRAVSTASRIRNFTMYPPCCGCRIWADAGAPLRAQRVPLGCFTAYACAARNRVRRDRCREARVSPVSGTV